MKMKLRIYDIHIFELRNEEINVKKILAVINATYAVAKRKPEKKKFRSNFKKESISKLIAKKKMKKGHPHLHPDPNPDPDPERAFY